MAGGLNLYGFASGDPVNFSDPFGLCIEDLCIGEGIALGAAVFAGVRAIYNWVTGRPITQNVVGDAQRGMAAGLVVAGGAGALGAQGAAAGALFVPQAPFEGFAAWGSGVVRWGSRAAGAVDRMRTITAEEAAKLDREKVQMARDFYQQASRAGRGAGASAARAELMERILDLQRHARWPVAD